MALTSVDPQERKVIIQLSKIRNLKYATGKCTYDHFQVLRHALDNLPQHKLIKMNLIMADLMVEKQMIDVNDGSMQVILSGHKDQSFSSSIFKRGDPVVVDFSGNSEWTEGELDHFKGVVHSIGKSNMIVGFRTKSLNQMLNGLSVTLSVATGSPTYISTMDALKAVSVITKARYRLKNSDINVTAKQTRITGTTYSPAVDKANDTTSSTAANEIKTVDKTTNSISANTSVAEEYDTKATEGEHQYSPKNVRATVGPSSSQLALPPPLNDLSKRKVLQIMLGFQEPRIMTTKGYGYGLPGNCQLNREQSQAVDYALKHNVTVIHGPPGTGKSTTIVALAEQLLLRGERIIICAPSNVAVDTLLEKLNELECITDNSQILRLGNRFKIDPRIHDAFSLNTRMSEDPEVASVQSKLRILAQYFDSLEETDPSLMQAKLAMFSKFNKQLQEYEKDLIGSYTKKCRILATTLQGIVRAQQHLGSFSTIIIDEISQSLISECYIPALAGYDCTRLVVAGDNKQLSPTVISNDAFTKTVLSNTMFDVLLARYGDTNRKLLRVQHRMSAKIMEYVSDKMYDGKLIAHKSVADRRLVDNPYIDSSSLTEESVVWIDTKDLNSSTSSAGHSLGNVVEAKLVCLTVMRLITSGVFPKDIGIISPYKHQVEIISNMLKDVKGLEIASVDGFQGREKKVIILTMIRTGKSQNVGYVGKARRINVAITRAQELLCIVGNTDTFANCITSDAMQFVSGFTNWCLEHARIETPVLEPPSYAMHRWHI